MHDQIYSNFLLLVFVNFDRSTISRFLPQQTWTTMEKIDILDIAMVARMPVPKMVKNGLNSPFLIWGQF
jgi:hypothetical protein